MRKLFVLLLLLVSITSTNAQNDKRLNRIDDDLKAILAETKTPGFAIAIVEGNKVLYAKGYGYRNVEEKIPVDANTLFAIGSTTKSFTAALLGLLREEGKLTFDDSPKKYIPELRFYNDEMNSGITLKDMMCHRTGLPRHDISWYLFPSYCKDSLLTRVAFQEPFTGLRRQWYYNNFMFMAQGVVAERVTGKSWEDNIRDRFFKPLGMTMSNVSVEELEKSTNAAWGYELKRDSVTSRMSYYHIAGMSPAGSINSSVNDMAKWMLTWLNGGKYNHQVILPKAYVDEAISAQMVVSGALPEKEFPDIHMSSYGYGWFVSSYKGHYKVDHGGNIDGFSANVTLFPADSLGVVVLANQNSSALPRLVSNIIADRMLGLSKTGWLKVYRERMEKAKKGQKEAVKGASGRVKNTKPSHIMQEYTGKYSHPGYGEFIIENRHDSLFAIFKTKQFYLKHHHYDLFDAQESTRTGIDTNGIFNLRFNFSINEAGDISSVKINFEEALRHPIEFKHTPNILTVEKQQMERYAGEYLLAGITAKVYIKNENTLYLFVPGQPEYELMPVDKHKFAFKALEGFKLEFVESVNNAINEVIIFQPNGTFRAVRKR